MDSKKTLWILGIIILCSAGVMATNFPPTYDYVAGNYNLTLTNTPVYNETSRSYDLGPVGNQKMTFAKTMNTTEFPVNTTPYTVLAYINLHGYTTSGANTALAVFKGWNSTNDTGYRVNYIMNSSGYLRTQFEHGGTQITNGLIAGFSVQQWIPVAWIFNGSQCWSYTDNSTATSGNASCVGKAAIVGTPAVQTIPDALCGVGTAGGDANGMCNSTIKYVMIFNRTISAAEFTSYANNQSFSGASILANFTFENTTSANVVVGTTLVRVLPPNTQGFHTALSPCANETWVDTDGDGTAETSANYPECQDLLNDSNVKQLRFETEMWNTCTYENSTTGTCIYNYTNSSNNNFKNFRSQRSLIAYAASVNTTVKVGISDMPRWLATNNSECNYGTPGGSEQQTCDAASYSSTRGYGSVVGRYLMDLGCFDFGKIVCTVDGDNEPYIGTFYLINTTAVPTAGSCVLRSTRINNHYNSTFFNAKAYLTSVGANQSLISWGSPAFTTTTISACAQAAAVNFSARFPYGSANSPDRFNWHPYSGGSTMALRAEYDIIEPLMAVNGWTSHWGITESEWNNAAVSNASDQSQKTAGLGYAFTYWLQNTTAQYNLWFKLASITTAEAESSTQNNFGFRPIAIQTPLLMRGSMIMSNITQTVQQGGDIYNCTTTDTDVSCAYMRRNSTYGILFVSNFQNNQLDIDNLSIQGVNITSITKVTANASETVTSGIGNPSYLSYYGVETYQITMGASNISATYTPSTYIVNISEPASQAFSVSLTNPSNQTYQIEWKNATGGANIAHCSNLTSCTQLGNYSSAGQYNWTVTVTGETNTLTKVWLLQINQTAQNISFATTTPSNSVSITVGGSQLFTYTLTNPDNSSAVATWIFNGTNQTSCFNQTSCTINAGTGSAGAYTLNLTVVSATNTLNNQWTVTIVTAAAAAASDTCNDLLGGFGVGAGLLALVFLVVIGGYAISTIYDAQNGSFSFDTEKLVQIIIAGLVVAVLFVVAAGILSTASGTC